MLYHDSQAAGPIKPLLTEARMDITRESPITYRPFIDGLRAVAVASVVAAHVGLPGFSGGFIGVDIFFVISGYLIIGQILQDLETGNFSFAKFWTKRALRIIPPMLATLLICSIIAPFVFVTPAQFREFGSEVAYSATMLVNYYFLYEQDYFDSEAIYKPLLHIWSLAVEEQFYLIAPVALFGFWKYGRVAGSIKRWLFPALACLAFLASLIACILYTQPEKNFAFYVTLCRAWEFIAGGAICYLLPVVARLPKPALELLAIIGLSAIVISVAFFNEAMEFPSYLAVLPVAGAFLFIISGIAEPSLQAARLLASPPLVWIGLVSYGWYLWHWPMLSFSRIYSFGTDNVIRDIAAVSIGLLLAVASYFLIERPCLRLRRLKMPPVTRRKILSAAFAGSAAVSATGIVYIGFIAPSVEQSIPSEMRAEKNTKVMASDPCWMRDPDVLPKACIDTVAGKKVVVLLGDSHARMLYPALKSRAEKSGMALISLWRSNCSPFNIRSENTQVSQNLKCAEYTERGLATLQQTLLSPPAITVVGGYWPKFIHGQTYSEFLRHGENAVSVSTEKNMTQLTGVLAKILRMLSGMGVQQILVMGPSAEFAHSPLDCALRTEKLKIAKDYCDVPQAKMNAWLETSTSALNAALGASTKAVLIEASNTFCDEVSCKSNERDVMYYTDYHHVSPAGAEKLLANTSLGTYLAVK
jgi:peptidoglycan/LPS O-acetylase OafA/YrhL